MYFGDHPKLSDRVFFDPKWLAMKIYEILDETVYHNDGKFDQRQLKGHDRVGESAETFLALMEEMEIIFERGDQPGSYVAPQYLPAHHPVEELFAIASSGLQHTALSVRLPLFFFRKVLLELLYHFGSAENLVAKYYWKNGILFEKLNTRVLVKGLAPNPEDSHGTMVIGVEKTGDHQALQREVFERILDVLEGNIERRKLQVKPQHEASASTASRRPDGWTSRYQGLDHKPPRWLDTLEISTDGRNFVRFLDCCLAAQDGELFIKTTEDERLPLRTFEPILDRPFPHARRVFLSYSHTDSDLLNRLRMHLSPLRRMKNIEAWSDQELLPGDPWDEAIRQNLSQADIVILLLTADFIASDYIWNVELKSALDRLLTRQVTIIPILLQPIDYGALRLDPELKILIDQEMLPKTEHGRLKAVTLWENPEEAFAKIAERIRSVIEPAAAAT